MVICHVFNYDAQRNRWKFRNDRTSCVTYWLNNTIEGVRRGVVVRVWVKSGNGMNDRVDKSRGIVTLMVETLSNIYPIEPLRLEKQAARMKRNWTDSCGNSPARLFVQFFLFFLCVCQKIHNRNVLSLFTIYFNYLRLELVKWSRVSRSQSLSLSSPPLPWHQIEPNSRHHGASDDRTSFTASRNQRHTLRWQPC